MNQMNVSNFDLNLLVVFNAIYEEKSLTHAGKRLRLTQPAISHSLNRLRSAFNNQLFVRHLQHYRIKIGLKGFLTLHG